MTQPYKVCPQCQQPGYAEAPQCWHCGLLFAPPALPGQTPPGAPPPAYYPPQQSYPAQQAYPPQQSYPPPEQTYAPPSSFGYSQPGYPPQGYPQPGYPPAPYGPYPLLEVPPGKVRVQPGTHAPGLALLLCFVIAGGGQFYNRQIAKGVVMLLTGPFLALLWLCTVSLTNGWSMLVLLLLPVLWVGQLIDAYQVASRLNRGEIIDKWQWF